MVTLDKKLVLDSLQSVRHAIGKSDVIPALGAVWLSNNSVAAYDGKHLGISAAFPAEIEPCGVPGFPLIDLLTRTPGNEVTFDKEDEQITLKMGRTRIKLQTLAPDRNPWPFPSELPREPTFTVSDAMVRACTRVLKVKVRNPVRVEHFGVIVRPASKGSYLYATDSQLLARAYVKGLRLDQTVILPRSFVAELAEGTEVYLRDDCVLAVDKGRLIASKMLDAEGLVDIEAVIAPYIESSGAVSVPEDLGSTVKRLAILARKDFDPFINMSISTCRLRVEGNYILGDIAEEFVVEDLGKRATSLVKLPSLAHVLGEAEKIGFPAGGLLLRGKNVMYLMVGRDA
jgi:DNA polymerase III sliding clamp (beta) subunit (PCNA family)